jgi:hypothetical protein
VSEEQLAAILAERVMRWRVGPDRFILGDRRWLPRWRFQPANRIKDAFLLLARVAPQVYLMGEIQGGAFWVRVRIAGAIGEARESSQARAVTFAIAKALGIDTGAND